jgi:nucleoid-associated protein EbfC
MANMIQMMKQAATMQRDLKRVQKELAKQKTEGSAGGGRATAVVTGEMTLESLALDPELMRQDPAKAQALAVEAVNNALKAAKKKAGAEMSKLAGGLGLGGLLGS